jgi:predicted amidophosphoribosyltransferase
MRLFNRNPTEPVRCPQCGEPLPPQALVCNMCGLDMRERQPDDDHVERGAAATAATESPR